MSCCNNSHNSHNNNNSHNDALTVDSNGCFNCDDYAPKVRGRFGLAWVSESPDCPCPEPIGWQVEFLDTPSKVEQKCQEMVRWINCPPLPRCDPCPPDELCCNPCCPPKCNPCAPKCNPCIPKCCQPCCQPRMPCCMCPRPKKREKNKCCCCKPKRQCCPPPPSCCRRRSPRRRPSPQRQYCTCGSDDQNDQPKCTCDRDDVPVKDTDDASGSGSANNICCKYPLYHECIPQQVATDTGECKCSSSKNTLMLYENENHIHSTDYYDTCNDEFDDDDMAFDECDNSFYGGASCRCSSYGQYNDNDASCGCYQNQRPKCLKHPNGKKFNCVKKTRSRNNVEKRRKQSNTKPKTFDEQFVKPCSNMERPYKANSRGERPMKPNTNEEKPVKPNSQEQRPAVDAENRVPMSQRVQQVQIAQAGSKDAFLENLAKHSNLQEFASYGSMIHIVPEFAMVSAEDLSIPDDVFVHNNAHSYYSVEDLANPLLDKGKASDKSSDSKCKCELALRNQRASSRPNSKQQRGLPQYYPNGCNQDTCQNLKYNMPLEDMGCNMETCDFYKGCSKATCAYMKQQELKQMEDIKKQLEDERSKVKKLTKEVKRRDKEAERDLAREQREREEAAKKPFVKRESLQNEVKDVVADDRLKRAADEAQLVAKLPSEHKSKHTSKHDAHKKSSKHGKSDHSSVKKRESKHNSSQHSHKTDSDKSSGGASLPLDSNSDSQKKSDRSEASSKDSKGSKKGKKKPAANAPLQKVGSTTSRMSRVSRVSRYKSKPDPKKSGKTPKNKKQTEENADAKKKSSKKQNFKRKENILMQVTDMENPLHRCDCRNCPQSEYCPRYKKEILSRSSSLDEFDQRMDHSSKNDIIYIINDIPEMPQSSYMYTNTADGEVTKFTNDICVGESFKNCTNYSDNVSDQGTAKRRWFGIDFFKTWCRKDDQKITTKRDFISEKPKN